MLILNLSESIFFLLSSPLNITARFSDLESIMATRISLIRSVRQKEQRGQIGTLMAPFARGLIEVEKQCLIRLSAAARDSNQMQIALNSIVRAQGLECSPTFEVSQEFASVLWLQREQKLAVQFLKDLVGRDSHAALSDLTQKANKAPLLARLVRVEFKILKLASDVCFRRVRGHRRRASKSQHIF
jgi:hypothetical protein